MWLIRRKWFGSVVHTHLFRIWRTWLNRVLAANRPSQSLWYQRHNTHQSIDKHQLKDHHSRKKFHIVIKSPGTHWLSNSPRINQLTRVTLTLKYRWLPSCRIRTWAALLAHLESNQRLTHRHRLRKRTLIQITRLLSSPRHDPKSIRASSHYTQIHPTRLTSYKVIDATVGLDSFMRSTQYWILSIRREARVLDPVSNEYPSIWTCRCMLN